MRVLTAHIANPANDLITIEVMDEPGAGGANHYYKIGCLTSMHGGADWSQHILFQDGPIAEAGVNGVTQEALLAIVIDRLNSFQAGPFACAENAEALSAATSALQWLKKRTLDRMAGGVEGKSVL